MTDMKTIAMLQRPPCRRRAIAPLPLRLSLDRISSSRPDGPFSKACRRRPGLLQGQISVQPNDMIFLQVRADFMATNCVRKCVTMRIKALHYVRELLKDLFNNNVPSVTCLHPRLCTSKNSTSIQYTTETRKNRNLPCSIRMS